MKSYVTINDSVTALACFDEKKSYVAIIDSVTAFKLSRTLQ